ncbi:sugar phosphate nucleotidyltransferase [Pseudomonadota bacterium]
MKGIILAGGNGRRLDPLTAVTNKHLLAIYNQPMIFYPLKTLINSGIKDIFVVTGKAHADRFMQLLGPESEFDANFSFGIQDDAGGIAQALSLAKDHVGSDNSAVILGDNIFEDNFSPEVKEFEEQKGARIFLKKVEDPERFGVAEVEDEKVLNIEEKPAQPKSSLAVTGLYMYDSDVFDIIGSLKPSDRGELEITDVNNHYIGRGEMKACTVKGDWTDAGTFESLYRANRLARKIVIDKNKCQTEVKS